MYGPHGQPFKDSLTPEETDGYVDDGSIVIDTSGAFQWELQKTILTEEAVEQLKTLRAMLVEGMALIPVNSKDTISTCLDVANKQGQLTVLDILIQSNRIIPAKYTD